MYGMVVLMALTSSAENPDFGRRNKGCHGCCGGGYYASCCGGGYYAGCCGGGYYAGCCGGGHYAGCSGGMGRVYGSSMVYPAEGGVRYYSSGYGSGYWSDMPVESAYYPPGPMTGAEGTQTPGAASATVRIRMPADGGPLTIDDYRVPAGGDTHVYVTLPINTNDTRKISFKTEIMKDGKRETVTKQVTVKPGQRTEVDFTAGAPKPTGR